MQSAVEVLMVVVLLVCLLVLPTTVSVVNKTEIVIIRGESGINCTEDGRHCIHAASCVDEQCVCPPKMHGNALIACVKEDQILCEASLDPYLIAYGGAKARITTPCRYRLTKFVTPNTAAELSELAYCSFEVFGITSITDYGVFYQKGVEVSVDLGRFSDSQFISMDILKLGVVDGDVYKYVVEADHSVLGTHKVWNGINVECYLDSRDNFAVLQVKECNTAIGFRPFNNSAFDPVQRLKPGIVIKTPSNALFDMRLGGFPGSLCGLPSDDPDIFKDLSTGRNLKGTTTAIAYELLTVAVEQNRGDYQRECTDAIRIVETCWEREKAVNTCNRIFSHKYTLRCLIEQHINPMLTFNRCLDFFCFESRTACEKFTNNLLYCKRVHKYLSNIQCPQG